MLKLDAADSGIGVQTLKPAEHALVELDLGTGILEMTAVDRAPHEFRVFDEVEHPGKILVHRFLARQGVCLAPELLAVNTERGDQRKGLHIVGRQRFIKVIADRHSGVCVF